MVVSEALEYEERAISLVNGLQFTIAQLEGGSTTRRPKAARSVILVGVSGPYAHI